MPVKVGGGIKTLSEIRDLLNAGADKVSINSAACKDPEFVRAAAKLRRHHHEENARRPWLSRWQFRIVACDPSRVPS